MAVGGRGGAVARALGPDVSCGRGRPAAWGGGGSGRFFASAGLLRRNRRQMLRAGEIRILARYLVSEAEKLQAQPLPRRDRVLRELVREKRICGSEWAAGLAEEEADP